jgi:hypothetical protein
MTHGSVDPSDGTIHPAYTYADHPNLDSVFQAPVVGQATDDDGDGQITAKDIPDIAVLMGDEFAAYESQEYWSAIRLISGDGSAVHMTTLWETFDGVDYAPYLFAGLAMANLDDDDNQELVTIVRADDRVNCFVGLYEITDKIALVAVSDTTVSCEAHAPALADMDSDGAPEIILGDRVFDGESLTELWRGADVGGQGAGWFNYGSFGATTSREGYWNSGYHSFAYDVDGDGNDMELVAGNTIYNSDGSIYCTLTNSGGVEADGYPAVADIVGSDGVPEIVISGNHRVSLYNSNPNSLGNCELIAANVNKPEDDLAVASELPTHPDCNTDSAAFGGPPTVADFTGDGNLEIGVAGSCWYSVYAYDGGGALTRLALTPTRDWSSASTGATVFDFNGDGANEVVFSDEHAVYVWWIDDAPGLEPWERMVTLLEDTNHKSWTIHEYPLVADVDGDGKAEIVAVNSHLQAPDGSPTAHYGIYVLGSADDDWVSAQTQWTQHAYYVTNVSTDGAVGYGAPNYAPYTADNLNSFRTQAPGTFGSLAASNLYPIASACQDECGPLTVWVQGANESPFIGAREDLVVTVYGVSGTTLEPLEAQVLPWRIETGASTEGIDFIFDSAEWSRFDSLKVTIDEGDESSAWGGAQECDEDDNSTTISLDGFCI